MVVYSLFHIDLEFKNVGYCGGKQKKPQKKKEKKKKPRDKDEKIKTNISTRIRGVA